MTDTAIRVDNLSKLHHIGVLENAGFEPPPLAGSHVEGAAKLVDARAYAA